jgi:CRISPR-associated protein (TIGR03986 family)
MSSQKPHRIRVRVIDGKPREWQKLKGQLGSHLTVLHAKENLEFVICAVNDKHVAHARDKLSAAGLEEIPGGDTNVATPAPKQASTASHHQHGGSQQNRRGAQHPQRGPQGGRETDSSRTERLPGKPYGFVPLPEKLTSAPPVWHDGTSTEGRLSGEIRCELKTLTPLLVGWQRGKLGDCDEPWPVPASIEGVGKKKSVLCPLRAPWGERPVILPGDSLKGLLRHELGALLGAPMERVAERSYSYRPNARFPKDPEPWLIARLARVPKDAIKMAPLEGGDGDGVRVPTRLELLSESLKYDKKRERRSGFYRFDDGNGAAYRGGQGAGERLNSKHNLHKTLTANPSEPREDVAVPDLVQHGYLVTLRHLTNEVYGHFSERHPDGKQVGEAARTRILEAAAKVVFQPGDLIWVEWDTERKCIVSLGWHYYYRWAYTDTVRREGGKLERHGLFPLPEERDACEGAPKGLSAVRRLFGYTGDNEGSKGIGQDDHSQLMGRLSVNAALEVVGEGDTDAMRFLPPTFLKELGVPRPSAVEYYLEQPHHPRNRPSDKASLVTYGDAAGYDKPGKLAGRKFYLDNKEAYSGEPWKGDSEENRHNERSTLALEASLPGRRFRFTVRFRDLDPAELAAVVAALCPHQFRAVLGGTHADGYCSKLGYARPLGWGSARIEAKALLLLDATNAEPTLTAVPDLSAWLREHYQLMPMLSQWLAIHRHKHPDAADYKQEKDKHGNERIYTFHTRLRAEHSVARRYRPE